MTASRMLLPALSLLLIALTAGCGVVDEVTLLGPGWRRLVVTVHNQSGRPGIVVVAEEGQSAAGNPSVGRIVGRVNPSPVPPGTVDVTIDLPPGDGWGIFVNGGLFVIPSDVPPDASGKAPFTFDISPNGQGGMSAPGIVHGWLGD